MKTAERLWNKQNGTNELLSVVYCIASCDQRVLSLNKVVLLLVVTQPVNDYLAFFV